MLFNLKPKIWVNKKASEIPFVGGKISIPFDPLLIPGLLNWWLNDFNTVGVTCYEWTNYTNPVPSGTCGGVGIVEVAIPQGGNSIGLLDGRNIWNKTAGGPGTNYTYSGLLNNDSLTCMGIVKLTDVSVQRGFHRFIQSPANLFLLNGDVPNQNKFRLFSASNNGQSISLVSTNDIFGAGYKIVCFELNTVAKQIILNYDGLTFTASNALCDSWTWQGILGTHYMGDNGAGGAQLAGSIGEHIYYRSVSGLTNAQKNSLGSYFVYRYPSLTWIPI